MDRRFAAVSSMMLALAMVTTLHAEEPVPNTSEVSGVSQDMAAYRAIVDELKALETELRKRNFYYGELAERDQKRARVTLLKSIRQRLDGYALALPANCAQQQPYGTQPSNTGYSVYTPGQAPQVHSAAPRDVPGRKPANSYSPRDIFCRPRGMVPDDITAQVTEAEKLKHQLATRHFDFGSLEEKRRLQARYLELEQGLARLGVPGDMRLPVSNVEQVNLTVQGGVQVSAHEQGSVPEAH